MVATSMAPPILGAFVYFHIQGDTAIGGQDDAFGAFKRNAEGHPDQRQLFLPAALPQQASPDFSTVYALLAFYGF